MKLFPSCILAALFLVFFIPGFSDAQILCRSSVGGHCVNLAAVGTIPGLEFLGEVETPSALFSKIYTFGVSFVGLAAFFMFTYGAIRYMVSGGGNPSEARKIMQNALLGLVLALVSYLILNIINPELVKGFNIELPKIEGRDASGPKQNSAPPIQSNVPITPQEQSGIRASNGGRNVPLVYQGDTGGNSAREAEITADFRKQCEAKASGKQYEVKREIMGGLGSTKFRLVCAIR